MKKYHGQPLISLVPDMMNPNEPPKVTAEQFAGLDLWTIPRRHPIVITEVPAAGSIMMTRTSKALRFAWTTLALPIPLAAADLRRVADAGLYGAAKVCRQAGFKVTYQRRKGYIVVWIPLSRKGDITIGRLNTTLTALWSEALKLNMESGGAFTVLKETKTAGH